MHSRAFPVLLVALGLILVACSGGDDSSGATPGAGAPTGGAATKSGGSAKIPDSCSLLTPDQIKAEFNFAMGAGAPSSKTPPSPNCTWQPVDFTSAFTGLELQLEPFDKTFFEMTKNSAKDHFDVPGVGEAAFFESQSSPYVLRVQQNGVLYIVYVVAGPANGTPEQIQQKVVRLAKLALAH